MGKKVGKCGVSVIVACLLGVPALAQASALLLELRDASCVLYVQYLDDRDNHPECQKPYSRPACHRSSGKPRTWCKYRIDNMLKACAQENETKASTYLRGMLTSAEDHSKRETYFCRVGRKGCDLTALRLGAGLAASDIQHAASHNAAWQLALVGADQLSADENFLMAPVPALGTELLAWFYWLDMQVDVCAAQHPQASDSTPPYAASHNAAWQLALERADQLSCDENFLMAPVPALDTELLAWFDWLDMQVDVCAAQHPQASDSTTPDAYQ